jgi:hypothetical protein
MEGQLSETSPKVVKGRVIGLRNGSQSIGIYRGLTPGTDRGAILPEWRRTACVHACSQSSLVGGYSNRRAPSRWSSEFPRIAR